MRRKRQSYHGPIPVAAIDIGASAIRVEIAEVNEEGELRRLDSLRRGVLLGNDTFTRGELSHQSIRAACEALRGFKEVIDELGVRDYRAIATSAVREADNRETFIDRVFMTTGLEVQVIEGSEENRLTYAAIHEALSGQIGFDTGSALLVEVGGGSADVALLSEGEIRRSATLALGAIRLRQTVAGMGSEHRQRTELYKRFIRNSLANFQRDVSLKGMDRFIAQGGDVRLVARRLLGQRPDERFYIVERDRFLEFCEQTSQLTREEVVRRYAVSYLEAETLVPALLAYSAFLSETSAKEVVVPNASLRRGLLLDLAASLTGRAYEAFDTHVLSSAVALARKYAVDLEHGQHVAAVALQLFDQLQSEHGLPPRDRLLLHVAALLHEVGMFVSIQSHHEHTQYVLAVSQLFGLDRVETDILSNVARYHRRDMPQQTHAAYVALPRTARMTVCKLAALLRVADALDKDHQQKAKKLGFQTEEEEFAILVDASQDWTMERMALREKGDLFFNVYGKRPVLRST